MSSGVEPEFDGLPIHWRGGEDIGGFSRIASALDRSQRRVSRSLLQVRPVGKPLVGRAGLFGELRIQRMDAARHFLTPVMQAVPNFEDTHHMEVGLAPNATLLQILDDVNLSLHA
jgi:hypothetical protein